MSQHHTLQNKDDNENILIGRVTKINFNILAFGVTKNISFHLTDDDGNVYHCLLNSPRMDDAASSGVIISLTTAMTYGYTLSVDILDEGDDYYLIQSYSLGSDD